MALDVQLLKESFEEIKPVAVKVVDHFYETLFDRHPEARSLFRADRMDAQKKALIQSLVKIFDSLEDQERLKKYLGDMGARHVGYGVEAKHYEWVGESLLATLKYFFDETWTPALESSWTAAIGLIAELMLAGAATVSPAKHAKNRGAAPVPSAEENVTREMETVLKELMRDTLLSLVNEKEIRDLAAVKARSLIKEAMQEQLSELREKYKSRKAA